MYKHPLKTPVRQIETSRRQDAEMKPKKTLFRRALAPEQVSIFPDEGFGTDHLIKLRNKSLIYVRMLENNHAIPEQKD
jgi:hypothetical protein